MAEHDEVADVKAVRLLTGAAVRVPSVLRCGALILALKVGLKIWGYGGVIKWVGSRVRSIPPTTLVSIEALRAIERAVAMAGAMYPGRALCLEQSLVLYYLLRRQGAVAVKYRQGVQPYPFAAHAWVECCGEPINDVMEHVKRFTPLPDQLP